jgi:hypothetical protein
MLWLFSCGEIIPSSYTVPLTTPELVVNYKTFVWSDDEVYMIWFSLFTFFWVCAFLMACTEYVQIVAVSSWYFSQNADTRGNYSICRGFWWIFRYNMGSLMFGSFLIACIWIIRIIFEYIDKKMKASVDTDSQMAAPLKCISKCCRCYLDCCHRFVKYINKNAYC